jgi:predicted glycoside hydrolase/deacetylase ChbG (UPF0249 family)
MVKKKIIINADDCGKTKTINEHIENAILKSKITSTTVMANMEDFEGAVNLFKNYGSVISFGWHINLTEGKPLLCSQLLLDKGFYKETEEGIKMDGRKFMRKGISSAMKKDIKKELMAQYTKLRDNGINITHADSHHHIHTSTWAIFFLPEILKETGIKAIRCMYNNVPRGLDSLMRYSWATMMKLQVSGLKMPDILCGFQQFIEEGLKAKGEVIELECHPGHPKYGHEETLLMESSLGSEYELISYRNL